MNWDAVSAIGSVLGAAGSFAAVVVALWLARNANRPQLGAEATLALEFNRDRYQDWVAVSVQNTGARAEKITAISFRARWRKERMLFELSRHDGHQLPRSVEPGESVDFKLGLIEFTRDITRAENFIRWKIFGRVISTRRIFVVVQTATGFSSERAIFPLLQSYFIKPDASLLISNNLDADHPVIAAAAQGGLASIR